MNDDDDDERGDDERFKMIAIKQKQKKCFCSVPVKIHVGRPIKYGKKNIFYTRWYYKLSSSNYFMRALR